MHPADPGPGTVYLIHLDIPYKHARHYLGRSNTGQLTWMPACGLIATVTAPA